MPTPATDRGDAAAAEEAAAGGARRRCVSCGARVGALFVQYSPGNIRLMKCDECKAVADPYIECEFMIILIDLILHKEKAYRHLLFNMLNLESGDIMGILQKSCLIYILLDAFRISFLKSSKDDWDFSTSLPFAIWTCGKVLMNVLLGSFVFMFIIFLTTRFFLNLSLDMARYKEVLLAILISSYFKLFPILMMIWEFPSSVLFIVEIFVLSSNTVALRVATQSPIARCFGVCFVAHAMKFCTEYCLLHRLYGLY
ncbi:protein arv1 homolog isoform X2 [Ananas comosus]|uniref:Protein ARV n=1 Tax=Ananas comosus TaxID=4615 RepID=A0A6P5FU07_ANACO|nr:protein arv1 homolog isoform X2 [Ananas comosus]